MSRLLVAAVANAFAVTLLLAHCSSSSAPAGAGEGSAGGTTASCSASGAGQTDCGAAGNESCCASVTVPSGAYFRSYDHGLSTNGASNAYAAKVSAVTVDTYEVTVARYRQFVGAEVAGWRPAAGSGKHTHLSGGGLNGGKEGGWDASWAAELATTAEGWSTVLACDASAKGATPAATWTAMAGANEDHPINCVDWYDAYAFCIWDGGFLPSESEWNYTAAGGDEQRAYPWSAAYPPGSTTLDCDHAKYGPNFPKAGGCGTAATDKVGSQSPLGDGKWGHADLGGNVFEWTLDGYASPYATTTCDDCAELTATKLRVIRGGAFDGSPSCLLDALRETSIPNGRSPDIGLRCARPPAP
jgi:sulfatase modifying factor 1